MNTKPKSKKALIAISIISGVILLLVLLVVLFFRGVFFGKSHRVEISADTIFNTQYNSGDLIKIGDKLYYNYEPTDSLDDLLTYGIYEISSLGSSRVYWKGPQFHPCPSSNLFSLKAIEGEIIADGTTLLYDENNTVEIQKYNLFTKRLETYRKLETAYGEEPRNFEYIDGVYFYESLNSLYMEKDGKLEKLFDTGYHGEAGPNTFSVNGNILRETINLNNFCYVSKDELYYAKSLEDTTTVCRYNIPDKKETEIAKLNYPADDVFNLFITDGKAVVDTYNFSATDSKPRLYLIDTESDEEPTEILKEHNLSYMSESIAVLDGYFYIGSDGNYNSEKGILAVDLNNPDNPKKIYDGAVSSIHILDNEWIYFTDEDCVLRRITHDGKKVELVFG